MDVAEFLDVVITSESGYFCLAIRNGESEWHEEWYNWPKDKDRIIATALQYSLKNDIYFSSYLFSKQDSHKENVIPSRTIQADLDHADLLAVPVAPTITVESSPGRYHAYWIINEYLTTLDHESLSKRITYAIPNCDRSGWALGRKLRLPNTFNYKYIPPVSVDIAGVTLRVYDSAEIESLCPSVSLSEAATIANIEWLDNPTEGIDFRVSPLELLEAVKTKLPIKVVTQYRIKVADRSAYLWSLMTALFRADLSKELVFYIAQGSVNNKFADLQYHANRELAKDVLRAELVVTSPITSMRGRISELRRAKGHLIDKRQALLDLVLVSLKESGEFVRTHDDIIWYIPNALGRPITISSRSDYLQMTLDLNYGLNSTETEYAYVVAGISSYARSLPASTELGSLSFYDVTANSLFLHTGRREVIRITPSTIDKTVNGNYGIVFPWNSASEAFSPIYTDLPDTWANLIFDEALISIVNLDKEEAKVILQVWFMFILFRAQATSRPVLALFGQPGSGKSTLMRRIYTILYGSRRSLGAITTPDDFDQVVSSDPLVVLDNVDTWERWLPDRLALAAATSDVTKRKLYTDFDTVTLRRQAMVGITAHNPKFSREDITDRLLLFTFKRLEHFRPEGDILSALFKQRNSIWGAIVRDIQKVLNTPVPSIEDIPQFRVEDFSRLGTRIARALGIETEFYNAMAKVAKGQKTFSLEEDSILVHSLTTLINKQKSPTWHSTTSLWAQLELASLDPRAFIRIYRNSMVLGHKLWSMNDILRQIFNVEWMTNSQTGNRMWKFDKKEVTNV